MSLYDERLKRTLNAVHMEPVDKVPFCYSGAAYIPKSQGMKISTYLTDFEAAGDACVAMCKQMPGIDSLMNPIMTPYILQSLWLSEVKCPGIELPEDELWQLHEKEKMHFDDYEKIIKMGYEAWLDEFMRERLDDPMKKAAPYFAALPGAVNKLEKDAQVVNFIGRNFGSPIENFCGGRTLMNFFMDAVEEPELVGKAMDVAFEYIFADMKAFLKANKPLSVWIGGWRACPAMMSHDFFMEFSWKYIKPMIMTTLDHGVIPILHFDSCWDSELETIAKLPEKKCVLMCDGTTDMRLAREILGDRMCLLGDVPATLQAFGTPDQCYNYVTDLINDVGPTGLIISSGCDVPLNAKQECVEAMIQATVDYRID